MFQAERIGNKLVLHNFRSENRLIRVISNGIEYTDGSVDLKIGDDVLIAKKYSDVNLIFNDCEFFGDETRVKKVTYDLKKTRKLLKNKSYPSYMFYNFFLSNKIFTFSSVMAKRKDLLSIDFNPPMDYLLDWWLWIQMAYIGKFYYLKEQLTKWRLHKQSYIKNSNHTSPVQLQAKIYYDISN